MRNIKTTPTAQNLIINKMKSFPEGVAPSPKDVEELMIEFARIHLVEAFEQISKKFKNTDNIRAVKKTYPLDNVE